MLNSWWAYDSVCINCVQRLDCTQNDKSSHFFASREDWINLKYIFANLQRKRKKSSFIRPLVLSLF